MKSLLALSVFAATNAFAQPYLVSDPAVSLAGFDGDWSVIRCMVQEGSLDKDGVFVPGPSQSIESALTPEHACRVDMKSVTVGAHILRVWFGDVRVRCCLLPTCTGLPACSTTSMSPFQFIRPGPPLGPTTGGIK